LESSKYMKTNRRHLKKSLIEELVIPALSRNPVRKHLLGIADQVRDDDKIFEMASGNLLRLSRHIALGIVTILFVSDAFTANAQVIRLDSVLQLIDRQNPMLQKYDHQVKALNEYSAGGKSWMAPMAGIGTFMTPYPGQRIMEGRDKGAIMLSVEQNIPNPAKLNANKRFLESKSAVEEQNRSYQFNQLRAQAKTLYYQWYINEKKMNVLSKNEQLIEFMIKLARIRYTYNQSSLSTIYKAEARLSEIENETGMIQGAIDDQKYQLKTLMNLSPNASIHVDTLMNLNNLIDLQLYDTAMLRTQRSDVIQIDKTIQLMRFNQQLQRQQSKPDFKVRFDHMQPLGNMPVLFTAMAMVSIPIAPWSSRMYQSEVKGMNYDIQAMQKEREAILIETQGMLSGMVSKIKRMRQQLSNYENKIIPALQKSHQAIMIAYEENREQLPSVIDSWEALNMAQMEYLNKMEEYAIMIVNYEKEIEK
jgi:outer membrane protein, heavy metal efflux system